MIKAHKIVLRKTKARQSDQRNAMRSEWNWLRQDLIRDFYEQDKGASHVIENDEFIDQLSDCQLLKYSAP
jgi:hypothetical protein